ncbi:MAG: TIGR02391 family protein [Candidatus Binataceae bacterium]
MPEAEQGAGRLRSELQRRQVHSDVLRFCRAELLNTIPPNYFHAVLEATKSVAQKIRDRTGLTSDGAEIVDEAFRISSPLLAINSLQTETEQSEQKGFANLLKGMFGTFRNVTGHAAKIMWPITEQDALDLLTLVSYLHRRLDQAVKDAQKPVIPKECKRLAEVDFPIAVVSRHSAREKSIRHGHPSTLHLWWARRPLAACPRDVARAPAARPLR